MAPSPAALTGVALAGIGAAHFVAPGAFLEMTKLPHPDDTAAWVLRDGASEVALGAAIAFPATRRLGWIALAGYVGWIVVSSIRNNQ